MSDIFVDLKRAVRDPDFAGRLTSAEWQKLIRSPEFDEMVGEFPELAEQFIKTNEPHLARFGLGAHGRAAANLSLAQEDFAILGKRIPRVQGLGVVTGLGNYVHNMTMSNMVYMRTLRSPHPHARVISIDTSQAEAFPGVVDIIHRFNLSEEENVRVSSGPPENYLFNEEVYRVGWPIAALIAESQHVADEAIRLIEVEYEVLPSVMNYSDGMNASTPQQWDNDLDGTILAVREDMIGDPAQGLAEADLVIEAESNRSVEQHMALELTTSLVWWDNERVHMYYTCQHAHGSRDGLAQRLGLPRSRVHVIQTGYMGSGYGYRSGIDVDEVHAAILSRRSGRPVKRMATRSEDFVTRGHRPEFHNTVKLGFTQDGTLTTITADVIANMGASGGFAGASGSWPQYQNLYAASNIGLKAMDVFTNSYVSGPYRCVSHPAATLGMETAFDRAAHELGMDPVELRLKNFNLEGNPFTGQPFSNPGIVTALTEVVKTIEWDQKWHEPGTNEIRPGVFHGIGIACHLCTHGAGSAGGSGMVIIEQDGSMNVLSGSTDIGPGERTLMTMIAAETVGIPLEMTSISTYVDTDLTSNTGSTTGSRQTNTAGWGAYEASMDAKRQLTEWGAKLFVTNAARESPAREIEVSPEELDVADGSVFFIDDPETKVPVSQVVSFSSGPIIGRGVHIQDPTWYRVALAAHAAEVEVDTVLGSVKVLRYVAAHDVGKALNPFALEQQIEGGVIMALGAALAEEMLMDEATGLPINDNILEYKALTIKDVPRKIDIILVEHAKEYGVYGAHGIGEPVMGPPGPTICNAVFNAIGVRVDSLPVTRDKILAALQA